MFNYLMQRINNFFSHEEKNSTIGSIPPKALLSNALGQENSNISKESANTNFTDERMQVYLEEQFTELLQNFQEQLSEDINSPVKESSNPSQNKNSLLNPRNKFVKPDKKKATDKENYIKDSDAQTLYPTADDYIIITNYPKITSGSENNVATSPTESDLIKKKILSHGREEVEQRCTRNGKEEIVLTRKMGDMKHILISVKKLDGTSTTEEKFVNFEKEKIKEFYEKWNANNNE